MKGDKHFTGIYFIKFEGGNKSYIGSSFDICKRGDEHIKALENKKHRNKKLQRGFNKYGRNSFKFNILEEVELDNTLSRKEQDKYLRSIEQHYLDVTYKAHINSNYFKKNAYNISRKATGGCGITKPIYEYSALTGEFVNSWISMEEATKKLELSAGAISRVLKGEFRHTKGKIFTNKKLETVTPIIIKQHKIIEVLDINKNLLGEFNNYNKASLFTNIHRQIVADRCKDNNLCRNKYYFRFKTK